jgi:RNA polymerase sigma-70 factor (ECF subfamily)
VNDVTLDDHFFRREAGRMVAVLTRIFGVHHLALAEDVAQEALCRAVEVWKLRGVPDNPSAWLIATAKNRARDVLRRERTARNFAPELARAIDDEWLLAPALDELFLDSAIRDGQLRVMFSCCDPRLPEQARIALVLNVSCGFGVREIAAAFLSGEAAIEKRIARAKQTLSESQRLFELADADFAPRLETLQRSLYLLFNEGYHGAHALSAVRVELCEEAMRLCALLLEHPLTAVPTTHALMALMALHAARLPARVDDAGDLCPFAEQDRTRWDQRLVAQGHEWLDRAATGDTLSEYHVEAAIAAVHAMAPRFEDTQWQVIVSLYDMLLQLRASPVIALSRAVAVAELEGPERGLSEIIAIAERERLARYPFYHAALGELELRCGRAQAAAEHFRAALALARNPDEKRFLTQRVAASST